MTTRFHITVRRALAICVMAVGAFGAKAEEEVLWWQVPDDANVATFHQGDVSASELGVTDARVITSEGNYLEMPPPDMNPASIPVPMGEDKWWFAYLPSNPEGLSFMIELGNWNNGQWVGLAQSRAYTYAELRNHIVEDWSTAEPTTQLTPWIADGYVVPEPSSGILLLIGGGLLALRRKRRG